MSFSLKSIWKRAEYKMAVNEFFCPPPAPVRQEMEEKGWKYEVKVIPVAAPVPIMPPAVTYPTSSTGVPVMQDGTPELYERYMHDLRVSAHKVYGL